MVTEGILKIKFALFISFDWFSITMLYMFLIFGGNLLISSNGPPFDCPAICPARLCVAGAGVKPEDRDF